MIERNDVMENYPNIKINNMAIKNYRAIDNMEYSPKKINIIIGKNNTGKSTILKAISVLFSGPYPNYQFGPVYPYSDIITYEVKSNKAFAQINSDTDEIILYKNLASVAPSNRELVIKELYLTLKKLTDLEVIDQNIYNLIFKYFDFFIAFNKDNRVILRPYLKNPEQSTFQKFLEEYNKVIQNKPSNINNFINWVYGFPVLQEKSHFRNINNVFFLTHEIKCFRNLIADERELITLETFSKNNDLIPNLERLSKTYVITKESDGNLQFIPYTNYGDGFIVLLNTLTYLLKAQNGILLIEEPENHLHPGYLSVFIEAIFQYSEKLNIQIFMTSHSTDLIDDVLNYAKSEKKEQDILFSLMIRRPNNEIEKIDYDFSKADKYTNELKLDLRGP